MKKIKDAVLKAVDKVHGMAQAVKENEISVYAAQASFFAILSAMPFLSLLISVAGLLPPAVTDAWAGLLPGEVLCVLNSVTAELQAMPRIPLLSLSVIVALWSASRGVSAVQMGLERIYRAGLERGYFLRRLISLVGTVAFIAAAAAFAMLIMFGDYIGGLLYPGRISDIIYACRPPFMLLLITLALTGVYAAAARRGKGFVSSVVNHVPGAAFTAVGWAAFSKGYALYLKYVPRASYIYGSIGAICLLMLWVYFCMIILLLGAQLNKARMERAKKG